MKIGDKMRTIVILAGRYLPGYKDGGPVRTLINLTDCLGEEYRFKIITNDRDHGDVKAYDNISYDKANKVGKAEVWYVEPNGFKMSVIVKLTRDADVIYICGPYDDYAYKTLLLKRLGKIKKPIVIAAMGSFSVGAFQIKAKKKKLFVNTMKLLGLFKSIAWSVTSELEKEDVKRIIGDTAKCLIAEDLPRKVPELCREKSHSGIRIIFLSRISEKKNLLYAVKVLSNIKCKLLFDIYGPMEEPRYWSKCEEELNKLSDNIQWSYKGMADSENIVSIFSKYDVFLFPTMGENYGHVIFEALAGGCIPIISDQTPWNDLEKRECGRVISLSEPKQFIKAINEITSLSVDELFAMQRNANSYAKEKYAESVNFTGYRQIFG